VRKEIPNDAARVAQLKSGQLDLITRVPASDVATLKRDPKIHVETIDTVYVFNLEMDQREQTPTGQVSAKDGSPLPKNPFLDIRVREAVDLAIDRNTLAEIAMEGLGKATHQIVTPSIFGFNPALPERTFDPAAARQLLTEAGYPNGFRIRFAFTSDRLPGDGAVCAALGPMLARIGIQVTVNATPRAVYIPAQARGDYSLMMNGFSTPTGEGSYFITTAVHTRDRDKGFGGFNHWHHSNAAIDALIQQASTTLEAGPRKQLLEQATRAVMAETAIIPLVHLNVIWGARTEYLSFSPRVNEETLAINVQPK